MSPNHQVVFVVSLVFPWLAFLMGMKCAETSDTGMYAMVTAALSFAFCSYIASKVEREEKES